MKFIDSNILIYAFYENKHQDACQNIIREGGITTTLALIEAFNIIEFQANRDTASAAIKGLLKSNIQIVDVDINIIFEALKRAMQYKKLKFFDLIQYTTASLHNCTAIMSYDSDFDNLEIKREP